MAASATVNVPKSYGYVLMSAASFHVLSMWLGIRIAQFRQAANVPHPSVCASAETIANAPTVEEKRALYLFNCAQRAHHNILENYTAALTAMLVSGISYPRLAAATGAIWVVGRAIYAIGYTSTNKRNVDGSGRFFYGGFHLAALSQVMLLVLVCKSGLELLD
ncbi:hypothetical protein K431DRAFT_153217 [Polychaeton citri CBS 116435]|uniref:Membrane-associated proteins in eicosanoid and glutathione metabolism n=1 Tax=Polychaeton citri CBS 116435 TaxID=1314669 RepID=A0A9P4Q379_9PEZI|nr:hypothetical protein K431DRAFT_153217 [Polychaeton citri CBS 116435]